VSLPRSLDCGEIPMLQGIELHFRINRSSLSEHDIEWGIAIIGGGRSLSRVKKRESAAGLAILHLSRRCPSRVVILAMPDRVHPLQIATNGLTGGQKRPRESLPETPNQQLVLRTLPSLASWPAACDAAEAGICSAMMPGRFRICNGQSIYNDHRTT
jgi:hypothetical protein